MPRIFGYNVTSADILKGPLTLLDAQASFQNIASFDSGSVNFIQWQFSLSQNGETMTGRLMISSDGTTASVNVDDVIARIDLGIQFNVTMSGSTILLQYSSGSSGYNTFMKYYEKAWI